MCSPWSLTLICAFKCMWGRRKADHGGPLASPVLGLITHFESWSSFWGMISAWKQSNSSCLEYTTWLRATDWGSYNTAWTRWLHGICWVSQGSGVERAKAIWELTWKRIKSSRRRWERVKARKKPNTTPGGKKHSNYLSCVGGKFIPQGNGGPWVQKLCTWHCILTCHKNYFRELKGIKDAEHQFLGDEKQD